MNTPRGCSSQSLATMLACAMVLGAGVSIAADRQPAASLFEYDSRQELDVRTTVVDQPGGAIVYDVSYASPKGGRVTAWLVTPRGKGRYAGMIFGHWGGGDRSEFLPEAILYARAGVVSLLPAYPWTRPAPWRRALKGSIDPANDFDLYVQAVVDLRRGIDLLASRPDVDPARIGYVGHSFGAQWGAILSAIDRRLRTLVLAAGVPDLAALYLESDDPDYIEVRTKEPERVARLLKLMAPLAAVSHVGRASPAPLLFQNARHEQMFPRAAMDRYYAAASEPKSVLWYPTAHDLNDPQALLDRAAWFRRHLGIGTVTLPRGE